MSNYHKWNEKEIKLLRKLVKKDLNCKEISNKIGLSAIAIRKKARRLKLKLKNIAKKWAKEDIKLLFILNEQNKNIEEAAKILGRPIELVKGKAKKVGIKFQLKSYHASEYSEEELNKLKTLALNGKTRKEIAKILKRKPRSIERKAFDLGVEIIDVKRRREWTNQEINELKELNKNGLTCEEISLEINKKHYIIRKFLQKLGLPINNKNYNHWSDDEIKILEKAAKDKIPRQEITKLIKRDIKGIQAKAYELNLELGYKFGKPFRWTEENTKTLIQAAKDGLTRSEIAKNFNWEYKHVIQKTNKLGIRCKDENWNNIKIIKENHEWLLNNYNKFTRKDIGLKLGITDTVIYWWEKKNKLKRTFIPKRAPRFFGKGWGGDYKGIHFRSLKELFFMILMDKNKLSWKSGEDPEYPIPYVDENGKSRNYLPDFIIEDKYIYEIKPSWQKEKPRVLAKKQAAEYFCKNRNMEYFLVDININKNIILEQLNNIVFDKDYLERFLNYKSKKEIPIQENKIFPFLFKSETPQPPLLEVALQAAPV